MSVPYYQDDLVTLYHGDCLEVTDWLAADVLVTDPPYGVSWKAAGLHSDKSLRHAAIASIQGDQSVEVRDSALDAWGRSLPTVVFGSWKAERPTRQITHRLIWHKKGRHPGVAPAAYFPNDEEIYLLGSGWTGHPCPTVLTTYEERAAQPSRVGHPTPKPIGLMERLVGKCPPGVIADPFAGSGSTLIAARNLGRRAIGVELEERYCEVIARRLDQGVLPLGGEPA